MEFKIKSVDIRVPEIRTLLMYLQYKCLPHDTPMEIDRGHWWVAYTKEGKPVAFAGLIRSQQWGNAGYMCRAGVLKNYQGYGLQKKLIQARIRKAKSLNWEWVITDTTDNPASSNSLISMGFKLYTPSKPWGFENSLYWRLNVFESNKCAVQRRKQKA